MPQIGIDSETRRELDLLRAKLKKIPDTAKKQAQTAFKQAAPILISAIQGRAPQSEAPHYRYSTPKLTNKLRAPNGSGRIVATYMPGNLKRSFKAFAFRRSASIYVGAKLDKSGSKGVFSGGRTDGYYAHWMEFGAPEIGLSPQPFIRPAVAAAGPQTIKFAAELLKRAIEKEVTI
jgi:HK97 gp10 family phage protein